MGFNPYFNGYSTLTEQEQEKKQKRSEVVSILILMDTLL